MRKIPFASAELEMRICFYATTRNKQQVLVALDLLWGIARVSPVLFRVPRDPNTHHCTLWLEPRRGQTQVAMTVFVIPQPRGPDRHGWHSLPECPGTFLRAISERARKVHGSVCVLRSVSWRCPTLVQSVN